MRQKSERLEHELRRVAEVSLLLAAACLVLCLVHIYYAISFVTPICFRLPAMNGKNLFPNWKFTKLQAGYKDPHRIPFTVSYYASSPT